MLPLHPPYFLQDLHHFSRFWWIVKIITPKTLPFQLSLFCNLQVNFIQISYNLLNYFDKASCLHPIPARKKQKDAAEQHAPRRLSLSIGKVQKGLTTALGGTLVRLYKIALIRSTACFVASASPKAVRRTYPSPLGPNPAPGVVATLARSSTRSKKSQDPIPPGVFTQM